jgi:hypothetical protein
MGLLRKLASFGGNVLRKVGQVGGAVLDGVGKVKSVMDNMGVTNALQNVLMATPETAPLGAGLALANKGIKAGQNIAGKLQNVGQRMADWGAGGS